MKKYTIVLIILFLILPNITFAAGSVTQTQGNIYDSRRFESGRTVIFSCVGDSNDGSIPDTAMDSTSLAWVQGWYLDEVESDPGATAPDAADVYIYNSGSRDLLDGNGVNLIHATSTQATYPATDGQAKRQLCLEAWTLSVANQSTASAIYVITLTFVK